MVGFGNTKTSEPTGLEPPLSGSVFRCNSDRMRRSTSLLAQRKGRGFIRQDYPPAIELELNAAIFRVSLHASMASSVTSSINFSNAASSGKSMSELQNICLKYSIQGSVSG